MYSVSLPQSSQVNSAAAAWDDEDALVNQQKGAISLPEFVREPMFSFLCLVNILHKLPVIHGGFGKMQNSLIYIIAISLSCYFSRKTDQNMTL